MLYIGIDPGVSGGLAWLNDRGAVGFKKMPDTAGDVLELIKDLGMIEPGACFAFLERVNAGIFTKPGQRMGVVSAFTFGRGVGNLETSLMAAGIPYDLVLPVKWQTAMGCRTKGDKNVSKARAQQLFPDVKVTHAIADALVIAEFCRRVRGSDPRARAEVHTDGQEDGRSQGRQKARRRQARA